MFIDARLARDFFQVMGIRPFTCMESDVILFANLDVFRQGRRLFDLCPEVTANSSSSVIAEMGH
jgi:hypothetical protein